MPGYMGVSWFAVIVSTGVRNALHPGRSVRAPLGDNKFMSIFSAMLTLVALGILLESVGS